MHQQIQFQKLSEFFNFSGESSQKIEKTFKTYQKYDNDFDKLLKQVLGTDFEKFNLREQLNLNYQSYMKDQNVVTIPILFHPTLYGVSMDIIYKENKICFKSYLTKTDSSPLYASDKNIINLISFYALKQNDKLINGSLSIDPLTGLFQYKTLVVMSLYEQINQSESFLECLKFNIKQHKELMQNQAPLVLYQMNKITFKEFKRFANKEQFENKEKNIDLIKKIFENQLNREMTEEEKENFLDCPKPKNLPLLTKINVENTSDDPIKQWKEQSLITSGGYSEIRKIQLGYSVVDNNEQKYTRALAVKTDKSGKNHKKVNHELQMLKNLSMTKEKGIGEAYIVTSYYDENLKDCYFMEFYNNGSLEQYANSKAIVLSLRTKLFILAGIINGIDFLHFKQIAHLDIKMGNILIQKQLIPKICDFGEAKFFQQLDQDKGVFSRSLPYAAPELYNKNEITPAFDIFSYGILMCNLIFEQFPFEYNPNDLSYLAERYRNNTYAIKRNLIKQTKYGPKKIMKIILQLIVLCLQSNPSLRPKPKWILAILWKMINFLDSF